MSTFTNFWSSVIQSVKEGCELSGDTFNIVVGGVDTKRIRFPCVHILPETSDYQGRQVYEDRITVNFYFERSTRGKQRLISNLEDVESTIDSILDELEKNSLVGEFKVEGLEFMAGDLGKLIDVVSVTFFVTKILDYGTA